MTFRQLLDRSRINIKVIHGGTNRIVAYPLSEKNHQRYLDFQVMSLWADFEKTAIGFDSVVRPIICCYINSYDYNKANGVGE